MIVPQRRRAPVSINYRRGFGVWNPPNRADYGLDPGGGGMHCDPRDVACVLEQTAAGNAFDAAMQDAQAQNNFDQCSSNASNATSQAQYDQVMQACQRQYAQQGGTSSVPTPSEPISTSYKTPYIVAPVSGSQGSAGAGSSGALSGGQLTFTTSRGGTALKVGDTWTVSITGAMPSALVTVTGTGPQGAFNGTTMGQTDPNGNFSKSGTFDTSTVGNWTELWRVGLLTSGSISFSVAPATTQGGKAIISSSGAGTQGAATGSGTQTTPPAGGTTIMGFDISSIPWYGWAAAGAAVLFFMGGQRGR